MLLLRLCYDNHNIAAKKNGKPLRLPPGLERQEKTKRSVGDEKKISGRTKKVVYRNFRFFFLFACILFLHHPPADAPIESEGGGSH